MLLTEAPYPVLHGQSRAVPISLVQQMQGSSARLSRTVTCLTGNQFSNSVASMSLILALTFVAL